MTTYSGKLQQIIDQASSLPPAIVSVASGKGGVGKTLTIINLAMAASHMQLKTLILDGDLGLANVDVVLGLKTKYTLADVFEGFVSLADILVEGPAGVKVIPSGSGLTRLQNLTYSQKQILVAELMALNETFDLILIDTGAGINDNVLHLNSLSHQRLIITTPEPHAITDAYALIKVLREEKNVNDFHLIVNMTSTAEEGYQVAQRLMITCRRFLGITLNYLGFIPDDPSVGRAVRCQQAAAQQFQRSLAGQAWQRIAQQCFQECQSFRQSGSVTAFWNRYIQQADEARWQAPSGDYPSHVLR